MSQDVNQDWQQREFIENVELGVRKCVDFLNHFQQSARYRLSVIDQRLTSLERKLDFVENELENADPGKRGAKTKSFKGSIFDPQARYEDTKRKLERRKKARGFTGVVIAPKRSSHTGPFIGTNKSGNVKIIKKTAMLPQGKIVKGTNERKEGPKQTIERQTNNNQNKQIKKQQIKSNNVKSNGIKNQAPKQTNQNNKQQQKRGVKILYPPTNPVQKQQRPPTNPVQQQRPPTNPVQKQQRPPTNPVQQKRPPINPVKQQRPPNQPGSQPGQPGQSNKNNNNVTPNPPPVPVTQPGGPPPINQKQIQQQEMLKQKQEIERQKQLQRQRQLEERKKQEIERQKRLQQQQMVKKQQQQNNNNQPGMQPGQPGQQPPRPPPNNNQPGMQPGQPGMQQQQQKFPHGDPTRIDLRVITPGTGPRPKPNGAVEIEYTGFLANNKQFIRHREVIQLGKRQNIKGLEQAVLMMQQGQRSKVWIPSKLAYGSRGGGSLIPPNANLTFDIILIRIVG